jgi:hypothetical protein
MEPSEGYFPELTTGHFSQSAEKSKLFGSKPSNVLGAFVNSGQPVLDPDPVKRS